MSLLLNLENAVCIDTETTGLDHHAEICEIAVVSFDEKPVFHQYLKTVHKIPDEVINIHHVTNEISQRSKTIEYYEPFLLRNLLSNKMIIGYNILYDIRLIFQSLGMWNPNQKTYMNPTCVIDVMQITKNYLGTDKWVSLSTACSQLNIETPPGEFHGALFDAVCTIKLLKEITKNADATMDKLLQGITS